MKVTRAAVAIVMMVVSAVEPQFTRFPALPSPPRIIFGGFRPIFRPRSRPRPRLRPPPVFRPSSRRPFFQQQDQFNVIPPSRRPLQSLRPPPQQVFQSSGRQVFQSARPVTFTAPVAVPPPAPTMQPPPPPSPRSLQRPQQPPPIVLRRPQQQPLPPPPPSPPPPPRVVVSQQRPEPPPPDARGFGSPRPESILTTFRPSSPDPATVGQQFSTRQPGVSLAKSNELNNVQQSGFPRPLTIQSDNNIIGMFPPPPPLVTTTLAPVVVAQTTATLPPAPITTTTITTTSNISPALATSNPPALISLTSSNSIVNDLPLLNAGVLPLAGEDSNEHMLFPPFNHLGIPSDLLSDQELFPPFPPTQDLDLFPPFDTKEN